MIVTCERCNARYKLDDSKIKGRGARITCPKCRHVFTVLTAPAAAQAPAAGSAAPEPPPEPTRPRAPARTADSLDFRKVGIPTWKVKVKIGLVYDFSDIRTLRKYIQDKRVTEDDVISCDGAEWIRIGSISDLDAFFVQTYQEREAKLREAGAAEDDERDDGPTMIVGMGALGANISTGVFARPTPPATPEAADAAPTSRTETGPAEAAPRFVDPFDALKARQRERNRSRRSQREAPRQGVAVARRISWPLLALVCVLGGVLWFLLRDRWTMAGATPGTTPPASSAQVPARDQEAIRKALIDRIHRDLGIGTPAPPVEPEPEPEEAPPLRPVAPEPAVVAGVQEPVHGARSAVPETPPPAPATSTRTTAADHALVGETAARAGNWTGAADAYRNAVEMDPANSLYRYLYGQALYRAGRYDDARAQLQSAANGGVAAAWKLQGRLLHDLGDDAAAMAAFQEYLKTNPSDRSAVEEEIRRLQGE